MNMAFWFFLAAVTVASLAMIPALVYVGNRLQERQEYYRLEFRKRMIDAGKTDTLVELTRYEEELRVRRSREKTLVASFVLTGVGVGLLVGLRFLGAGLWMIGFVPISIGLSLFAARLVLKPGPTPTPPSGLSGTGADPSA